jgi:hypothetical protein
MKFHELKCWIFAGRECAVECKQTQDMQIIHYGLCFSGNIWLWLLSQNGSSKMAPFKHQNL